MFGVINIRTKTREDANLTGISEACKHLNHIKYFLPEFCNNKKKFDICCSLQGTPWFMTVVLMCVSRLIPL